jgi:3-deoxy-D-manno-octulosonic acid kinase
VPEALAAVQSRAGIGYHGCFVTRRIPRARPAALALADASESTRRLMLESIGRSVRRFHEAGGVHADLNAWNLLVQEEADDPTFVIDLDRATVLDGPTGGRRARANLRRLYRSFEKLNLAVALDDWVALEEAYAAPPEPPPAA